MKNYIIVDSNDYVTTAGTTQDANIDRIEVPPGHRLILDQMAVFTDRKVKFVGGTVTETDEPLFPPSIEQLRSQAYPRVGDQLEALWDYIANQPGEKPEKVRQILTRISDVKAQHPKEPTPGRIDRE